MPRAAALVVVSASILALGACSPEPEDGPPEGTAAPETIVIRLDTTGLPAVDRDTVLVDRGKSPVIRWTAEPDTLDWIVAFPVSPFRNSRQVLHNAQGARQAPILATAEARDYKYSVFVAIDDSTWVERDPKIVIRDDPASPSRGSADSLGDGN